MKKITLLLVILMMSTLLVGCGNKEKITTDDFNTIAKELNFEVIDSSDTYGDMDVKSGTTAMLSGACSVEFIEFESEEDAINTFNIAKSTFSVYEESSKRRAAVDLENYDKYTITTDIYYMYVSRVDNTLVYSNTISSHKEDVAKLIDKMGY